MLQYDVAFVEGDGDGQTVNVMRDVMMVLVLKEHGGWKAGGHMGGNPLPMVLVVRRQGG